MYTDVDQDFFGKMRQIIDGFRSSTFDMCPPPDQFFNSIVVFFEILDSLLQMYSKTVHTRVSRVLVNVKSSFQKEFRVSKF